MIAEFKINFQKIKDRITAAELMNLSGREKEAKNILCDLASDIQNSIT